MSVISDVAQYLASNGLGTLGTDIFFSYKPAEKSTGIFVLDTGGPKPDENIPTKRPNFQVFIRASSYTTGKATLESVRSLLHRLVNTTVGSTYFYYILLVSEGGHIGADETGNDEFSLNFDALIR